MDTLSLFMCGGLSGYLSSVVYYQPQIFSSGCMLVKDIPFRCGVWTSSREMRKGCAYAVKKLFALPPGTQLRVDKSITGETVLIFNIMSFFGRYQYLSLRFSVFSARPSF